MACGLSYGVEAGTPGWYVGVLAFQEPQRGGRVSVLPSVMSVHPALVHLVSCTQYIIFLRGYTFCLGELSSFSQFIWWQLVSQEGAESRAWGPKKGSDLTAVICG